MILIKSKLWANEALVPVICGLNWQSQMINDQTVKYYLQHGNKDEDEEISKVDCERP